MHRPVELIQESAFRALDGERFPGERIPEAMFRIIAEEVGTANLNSDNVRLLRETLSDKELPQEEKSQRVAEALGGLREQAYGLYGELSDENIDAIENQGEELTRKIINGAVSYVERYPDSPDQETNDNFVEACREAFQPEESRESKLRTTYVATEVMTPYLSRRLAQIDWSDKKAASQGIKDLMDDLKLLGNFYAAIAPVIEKGFSGHDDTHRELAEGLFKIGPLFAKMGQVLANGSSSSRNPNQARFLSNVGRAMQEGIVQPTAVDIAEIQRQLPKGIEVEGVISSASIAHVVKVRDQDGREMAVKIRRKNIEQAIANNVRSYQIIVDLTEAFVEYHAGDEAFDETMKTILKALPFGLQLLEDDAKKELDTKAEANAQTKAREAFYGVPGVVIPEVHQDISDENHLFMDIEPAVRISDLPANPELLKNMMVMALNSWRHKIWHADLHAGNIKGREDGTIVVYDWARPVELKPKFIGNVFRLMSGFALRSPKRVARSYLKVQSPDYESVSNEEAESTAKDVFTSNKSWNFKKSKTFHAFVMQMGIHHQSALNFDYLSFIRSFGAFSSGVLSDEVNKPEYGGSLGKAKTLVKAYFAARKVLKNSPKNTIDKK